MILRGLPSVTDAFDDVDNLDVPSGTDKLLEEEFGSTLTLMVSSIGKFGLRFSLPEPTMFNMGSEVRSLGLYFSLSLAY